MPQASYPDIIDNLALFSGLGHAEKTELLRDGRMYHYKRGEYLFHHGDPIQYFYIICSGTVQLLRANRDGDHVTTDLVIPGKTICKDEIFHHHSNYHQVSALAVDEVVAVQFAAGWLKK